MLWLLPLAAALRTRLSRPRLSLAAGGGDFDRSAFAQTRQVTAVVVEPECCSAAMKLLQPHMLQLRGVQPVQHDGARRVVLLDFDPEQLPPTVEAAVRGVGGEVRSQTVTVGYEQLTAVEALRKLLPAGMEVPSSFEQVGHVAHVNLREEQLPYKQLIGAVLLEKNAPRVRSVVNKVGAPLRRAILTHNPDPNYNPNSNPNSNPSFNPSFNPNSNPSLT